MKMLTSGQGELIFDVDGTSYLDAISGVYNVSFGHGHPKIVQALREASNHVVNCYDNPTPFRARLVSTLKSLLNFDSVRLFSVGAESVEKALQLALRSLPSPRQGVIHFTDGFHGKTWGTQGLFDSNSSAVPYRHLRLSPYCSEDELLSQIALISERYGVVILEPVMAFYGHIFTLDFLRELKQLCMRNDTILIFDEMVTGFGRTGKNFVCDEARADIVVTAKGLGQGLPIAAVAYDSDRIQDEGFSFTTATSNCAFLCAIGLASCSILIDEQMAERSEGVGVLLENELRDKAASAGTTFSVLRSGSALFLKLQDTKEATDLETELKETHHILTRAHNDTLVLMPPFVISLESLERLAECICRTIARLRSAD